MAWVKLDDGFYDHPKVLRAGAEGVALWVCGLAYCNRQPKRDGFIPDEKVSVLYPMKNATKAAARLVEVRLWERVEGGYRIHDYHDYQPTAEDAADLSAKRAEAGRAGGRRSGESRRGIKQDDSTLEASAKQLASKQTEANREANASKTKPEPDPDPDPVPNAPSERESDARSLATRPVPVIDEAPLPVPPRPDPMARWFAPQERITAAHDLLDHANRVWGGSYSFGTWQTALCQRLEAHTADEVRLVIDHLAKPTVRRRGGKDHAHMHAIEDGRLFESWLSEAKGAAGKASPGPMRVKGFEFLDEEADHAAGR